MKSEYRSGLLGQLDSTKPCVTVVGAGISGLLAAYYLRKKGFSVSVLESSGRVGGLIDTVQTPCGMAERAAHSFVMSAALQELFDELNLSVVEVNPQHRARFILRRGQLRRLPLSFFEILSLIWRFLTRPLPSASSTSGTSGTSATSFQTIDQWGRRHWGGAANQYLLAPMIGGIYAGDTQKMSWTAAFPTLALAKGRTLALRCFRILQERRRGAKHTSHKKGMVALTHGSASLVKALAKSLEPHIQLNTKVQNLKSLLQSGNVVLTIPAFEAAPLLEATIQTGVSSAALTELPQVLRNIDYVPLVTCTVFVNRAAIPGFREGVGVLIPAPEGFRVRGVLFNSSAFEGRVDSSYVNKNILSFTVMLGGAADSEVLDLSDIQLRQLIELELGKIFGLKEPLLLLEVTRWNKALPHYTPSIESFWNQAHHDLKGLPGLVFFGNYTGQVSIRGLVESLHRL